MLLPKAVIGYCCTSFKIMLLWCAMVLTVSYGSFIPNMEMNALKDLFVSTLGETWIIAPDLGIPWNFTDMYNQNPCAIPPNNWYGVQYCYNDPKYNDDNSLYTIGFLELPNSNLYGTVPESLTNLTFLNYIDFSYNHLFGTFPSIATTQYMEEINLFSNYLTGTVPEYFNQFSYLLYVDMSVNAFTGTVPSNLGGLTRLLQFIIYENYLSGTLPISYGNITTLQYLQVNFNLLTGTLPSEYGQITDLIQLDVYENYLTGTLPEALGSLKNLNTLWTYHNYMTGTVPHSFSNLTYLFELNLSESLFTGEMDVDFSNMLYLDLFLVSYNLFSGPLPITIYNATSLAYLSFSSNLFTGSISDKVVNLQYMQQFLLNNNRLTGTLPSCLNTLQYLQVFYLQHNKLRGNLHSLVNSTIQLYLSELAVSDNEFSGTLPEEMFKLKSLVGFGAGENCLGGSIPQSICSAKLLGSLILDGVSSSSDCQRTINPLASGSHSPYMLTKHITGSIPSCVFSLPNLQTLHLSGNSITGNISDDIVLSASLQDLSLSHNQLVGTVPTAIQSHTWTSLDLSFNKLTGVLSNSFHPRAGDNTSLSLQVNRLSGEIPSSMRTLTSISVLEGNVFSCGMVDRGALPEHDSTASRYQCGSNSFNTAAYAWIAIGGAFALGCLWVMFVGKTMSWPVIEAPFDAISHFQGQLSSSECYFVIFCAILCIVFIPLYVVLTVYFHTYTHSYAWAASAAFLSGSVAGGVLFAFWTMLVLMLAVCLLLKARVDRSTRSDQSNSSKRQETQNVSTDGSNTHYLWLLITLNIVIVVGVNVFYVWVTLNSSNLQTITFMEILIALFKLAWNGLVIPRVFSLVRALDRKHVLFYRICIVLFNNIIAPCAATAAVSPNCFYYVLTSPGLVESTVNFLSCKTVEGTNSTCLVFDSTQYPTSFYPPFIYSFQCSSTLVTNYAAIFVYMFLIDAFITPLVYMGLRRLYVCHDAGTQSSLLRQAVSMTLSELSKPVRSDYVDSPLKPLFNRDAFVLRTVNCIAILLTFGVVFPLLAVVICVDMVVNIVTLRLSISSVLSQVAGDAQLTRCYRDKLNTQCEHVFAMLGHSLWVVVLLAAVFYSLFLFDIIGDEAGWQGALWAPLSLISLSIFMYLLCTDYFFWCSVRELHDNKKIKLQGRRGLTSDEEEPDFSRKTSTLEIESTTSPLV